MKDTIVGHIDFLEMRMKKELHPIAGKKRTYLPPICYKLTKEEKH